MLLQALTNNRIKFLQFFAATKKHLTQKLENVDAKLDEQKEISKIIKDEVFEVRGDLTQIGFEIDAIQKNKK